MPHIFRSLRGSRKSSLLILLFGAITLVGVLLLLSETLPFAAPVQKTPVQTAPQAALPEQPVTPPATPVQPQSAPVETPPASAPAPAASLQQNAPRIDWFLDTKGVLALGEILFPTRQEAFTPYDPLNVPRQAGTSWFRIRVSALQADPATHVQPPLVLDLNTRFTGQLPGTPQVWLVARGEGGGSLIFPKGDNVFELPAPLPEQATIYIRTNGVPGPGFVPLLRNAKDLTLVDNEGMPILLIALGLCLLFCLLRGVAERREWRMWAALYVGAIWVQAFWGIPATPAGVVSLWDMPGLLAPGVALLILPHVGRHLMRTREQAPFIDAQLILLALPGIVLSVAPLVPGYAWTLRFLPLWPLLMILFLPSALVARIRKLPGARRFFFICLFPPLGWLLPGLFFFPNPFIPAEFQFEGLLQPGIISLIPLIGLILSALLTALTSSPRTPVPARKGRTGKGNPTGTEKEFPKRSGVLELGPPLSVDPTNEDLELSLGAPSRSTAQVDRNRPKTAALQINDNAFSMDDLSDMPLPRVSAGKTPAAPISPSRQAVLPTRLQELLPLGLVEEALRVPLETVLREISAIDQARLDPEARRHADALGRAGRSLASVVSNLAQATAQPPVRKPHRELFELSHLLLEAHNTVAQQAEAKNLALSWFVAPHLPHRYEGPRTQLAEVLSLLAESSVRATERGMVQIRAQRLPESTDPGHLLFTISDSGNGAPPLTRSSLPLVRAWELVGSSGELVTMESGPTGSTISFSIRLTARMAEQRAALSFSESGQDVTDLLSRLPDSSLRIIIASAVPGNRQLLAYYLDELPHEILETRSTEEVQSLYFRSPGALIIFDDDIPEDDIRNTVAAIRVFEGEHSFPLASILALVSDEGRAERLHRAGCTHILMKPIVRTELRHLTLRLAPVPRRYRNTFTEGPVPFSGNPSSTRSIPTSVKTVSAGTAPLASGGRGKDLPPNTPATPEPSGTASLALTMPTATPPTKPGKTGLLSTLFSSSKQTPPAQTPPSQNSTGPKNTTRTSEKRAADAPPEPTREKAVWIKSARSSNVGEPMPIAKPAPIAKLPTEGKNPRPDLPQRTPIVGNPASTMVDPAIEWVGEPTPVFKRKTEGLAPLKAFARGATPAQTESPVTPVQSVDPTALSFVQSAAPAEPVHHAQFDLSQSAATERSEEEHALPAEWVGDPIPMPRKKPEAPLKDIAPLSITPVQNTASAEEKTGFSFFKSKRTEPAPAQDLLLEEEEPVEWVGDPVPVTRNPTPANEPRELAQPAAHSTPERSARLQPATPTLETPPLRLSEPETRSVQHETLELSPPSKAVRPSLSLEDFHSESALTDDKNHEGIITLTDMITDHAQPPAEPETVLPQTSAQESALPDLFGPVFETPAAESPLDIHCGEAPAEAVMSETPVPLDLAPEDLGTKPLIPDLPAPAISPTPVTAQDEEHPLTDAELSDEAAGSDENITQLLHDLDAALEQALQGQYENNLALVREAAETMARLATDYDLRVLDDPAQCMRIAADAGDREEVAQLMPDLVTAVARNRSAFETN